MAAFQLFITGLGMFVPGRTPGPVFVLFPKFGTSHVTKLIVRRDIIHPADLAQVPGLPYEGDALREIDITGELLDIGDPAAQPDHVSVSTAGLLNVSSRGSGQRVRNRYLVPGTLHTDVATRVQLHVGSMGPAQRHPNVGWEMLDNPGYVDFLPTGVCWKVPDLGPEISLKIPGMLTPMRLQITSPGETLIISHSIAAHTPSNWKGTPMPVPKNVPRRSHPQHFPAYHKLIGKSGEMPMLQWVGLPPTALDKPIARPTMPCPGTTSMVFEQKGIHPIDCILSMGDPNDPDDARDRPTDSAPPGTDHDHGHLHSHQVSINPHDRSRVNVTVTVNV